MACLSLRGVQEERPTWSDEMQFLSDVGVGTGSVAFIGGCLMVSPS